VKQLFVIALALVTLAALAPLAAAGKVIKIGDDYFLKPGGGSATVSKNSTVKWTNTGDSAHTVTVISGPVKFNKSPLKSGASYSRKMTRAGTYKLVCRYHDGQKMTLRVK
jgi:plastocyanin